MKGSGEKEKKRRKEIKRKINMKGTGEKERRYVKEEKKEIPGGR